MLTLCAFRALYIQKISRQIIRSLSDTFDTANRIGVFRRIVHLVHEYSFPPYQTLVVLVANQFNMGRTSAEKNVIVALALRLVEKHRGTGRVSPLPRARSLLYFKHEDAEINLPEKLFFLKQLIYEDGDFLLTFLLDVNEIGLSKGNMPVFQEFYFRSVEALLNLKKDFVKKSIHDEFLRQNLLERRTVGINERIKALKTETAKTRGHRTRSRLGWLIDLGLIEEHDENYIVSEAGKRLINLAKEHLVVKNDTVAFDAVKFCLVPLDSDLCEELHIPNLGKRFSRDLLNNIAISTYIGGSSRIVLRDEEFLHLVWEAYQKARLPLFDIVELETLEEIISNIVGSKGFTVDFESQMRKCNEMFSQYFDVLSKMRGGEGMLKFKKPIQLPMGSTSQFLSS